MRVWRCLGGVCLTLSLGCGGGGGGGGAAPEVVLLLDAAPVLVAPGTSVSITYADQDAGQASSDLYADADGDPATTGDRIAIALHRPDGDGVEQTVLWDTTAVPSGMYSIVVVTRNGSKQAVAIVRDYVMVNEPPAATLEAPADAVAGAKLVLRYAVTDRDDDPAVTLVAEASNGARTQITTLAKGAGEFVWTPTLADGAYTLLLIADDGHRAPVAATRPFGTRSIAITVKDASGRGADAWPVTAIVPLKPGRFTETAGLHLVDDTGAAIPAQFEVLNRWWHGDRSLRHVAVHFLATVPAGGNRAYRVRAGSTPPAAGVTVTETPARITVDTGVLSFSLDKKAFNLFDEVTYGNEQLVPSGSDGPVLTGRLAGDLQAAAERGDLVFEVEETGPVRAVVKVSAKTIYNATNDHLHGFACRIYAYAGKGLVRVDYQLQNSAINVRRAWPLYFEDLSLRVRTNLGNPAVRLSPAPGQVWSGGPGTELRQESLTRARVLEGGVERLAVTGTAGDSSFGWVDITGNRGGVAVMVRHMAEMWPNGIEIESDGTMAVKLWPAWGEQRDDGGTGLYWLEDMQHVVKEVLFRFHAGPGGPGGLDDAAIERCALNFQYPPVALASTADYQRTAVTLDLLGLVPHALAGSDARRVAYGANAVDPTRASYNFGWRDFGGDMGRKYSATSGNWPSSAGDVLASGRVDSYFRAERDMWGDLNTRPMWLSGYDHDEDFDVVRPTVNPYAGSTWRVFDGHGVATLAEPRLAGTASAGWTPRDNEHGWFYHIEEYYLLSGNPWVRDWYEFIAEFRKRTLYGTHDSAAPYFEWGFATRGEGHMLANVLQAYRVTGDEELLVGLRQRIRWLREVAVDRRYGVLDTGSEAPFQIGYLARALLSVWRELKDVDRETAEQALLLAWGMIEWNEHIARWGYYVDSTAPAPGIDSSGTSLTMVDPAAAFYLITGRRDILDDTVSFVTDGFLGGERPYGGFPWTGGWEGRAYSHAVRRPKTDETPPAAVTDLALSGQGLRWTAPVEAASYLVVRSDLPITADFTTAADERNFWAGDLVPQQIVATPGTHEELPVADPGYYAVVPVDRAGNLGAVSNVVRVP